MTQKERDMQEKILDMLRDTHGVVSRLDERMGSMKSDMVDMKKIVNDHEGQINMLKGAGALVLGAFAVLIAIGKFFQ